MAQLHRHDAVALHHRFRGLDRVGQKRLEVRVGSGAVHHKADVEIGGGFRHLRRRVVLSEIDCQRAGLDASAIGDPGGHLVEHGLASRHQHNVDSALGNPLGERGAHTVGCAGHQRPRTVLGCERHAGSARPEPPAPG